MVGSSRNTPWRTVGLVLTASLASTLSLQPPARAADDPPAAKDAEKDKDKTPTKPGRVVSPADRAAYLSLTGEEAPAPFVPLRPRTVEDRKRVESLTDFSAARALEAGRNWADAVTLLEASLKLEPDSVTVLRRLSRLCFILARTEQGIAYSKRVLAADPGDSDTIIRLVNYYSNRRNEPAGAEAVLKDVLANPKLDPKAPGRLIAENELGKLYSGKLLKIDKAADAFAKVVEGLDDKSAVKLSSADHKKILGMNEAAAYMEFGLVFQQAKRLDLAAKAFERGLDYDDEDPQLPLLLSQTLVQAGRSDKALSFVEHFLKRQPQGVEGYELQAKILTELKRGDEITPRLEEAVKKDSKNVGLQYVLADRYRETGQTDKADALYKTLLAQTPTTQGYGALATSLLKRKKAEELLKVISDAVVKPGGVEAVQETIKGVIAEPEFAAKIMEAGRKLMSADPPALSRPCVQVLAYVASRADKLDDFLPIQRMELKRSPNPQSYKEVVQLLTTLKKYDEAAATVEELMIRFPAERNARMLGELVREYRLADKPEDAVKAAREALKLDPNDLDAQVQLALTLNQTGKTDEAFALLRASAKREPANPMIQLILGGLLVQSGKNDEAAAVFKTLLEKYPNNDEVVRQARSNLSIIYVNLGDYAKGEAELEILLERNPEDPGVNNDLGYLYADQGKNLEKAETMIRMAVQAEPDNSAYLDSLGWVLFKRGKAKDAVEPLEKATRKLTEISSTDATVFEHLGDVYFRLQDAGKAKKAWQDAEKAANKANPPDKRLPEIRKKLESLEKLSRLPSPATGDTP